MSQSFVDKLMKKFPELLNLLSEEEEVSEVMLASVMLVKMTLGEKFDQRVCEWAAQVMVNHAFAYKDSEHAKALPILLKEMGSEEAVANFVSKNAAKIFAAQQKAFVLAYFKKLAQT